MTINHIPNSRENKGSINIKVLAFLVILFILIVLTIKEISSSSKNNPNRSFLEKTAPEHQFEKAPSLVKIHILRERKSSKYPSFENPKRNIFNLTRKVNIARELPIHKEKIIEENEEIMPSKEILLINFKLIGLVTMRKARPPSNRNVNYAILSTEEEVFIVKKGDVLADRYKILDVGAERVEIKDILLDKIEILSLERE
ncbi:MAG: hypothetical protein V3U91_02490 [Candidatus Aminicenantaceae bacterium]